ncbi:MAG: DUF2914 domain-containing protein [Elusimicrobia bacterium]|nr:DUF2914 domain-containing protein [Elusimicrobiota bacterium]
MLRKLMFVLSFVFFVAYGVSFSAESTGPGSKETAVSASEEKAEQPESNITVSDAKFCTSVSEREPVGANTSFSTENNVVYYWSNVKTDAAPASISHVWTFNGEKMAEISLNIKNERTRTWSSKTLMPEWTGEWTVETKDSNGNTIRKDSFTYNKTEATPKSTESEGSRTK